MTLFLKTTHISTNIMIIDNSNNSNNSPRRYADPLVATQLFETALEKRERLGPEASLLLESELGLLLLRGGKLAEAKEVVEKGKVAVEDLQVRMRACLRVWILSPTQEDSNTGTERSKRGVCLCVSVCVCVFCVVRACVRGVVLRLLYPPLMCFRLSVGRGGLEKSSLSCGLLSNCDGVNVWGCVCL